MSYNAIFKYIKFIISSWTTLYQQQGVWLWTGWSVQDARFVGGDHVLDINEGVLSSVGLEHFQGLLDKVAQVLALSLGVVDFVTEVHVWNLEQVHHW